MARDRISRRSFLAGSMAGAAGLTLPSGLSAPADAGAPAILKTLPPEEFVDFGTNAEMRWGSVDARAFLTPQRKLFVRNHTLTPTIDRATYALRVHGDGLHDPQGVTLTLEQLRRFPRSHVVSVHECTGNGRRFFGTQQGETASGTQWALGAVGTVRWEGVRLADVLKAAGVSADAVSIQAAGLDQPFVSGGVDYGHVRRPFPVSKAYDDALLAWGMNGEPLLPDHGAPLRLVLPGWVGIASIKWLGSLEVSTAEQTSPWNTKWYRMSSDQPPLTTNPVRSAWELPWDARVPTAPEIVLTGRSWSGAGPIARVEVSLDDGSTWQEAKLHAPGRGGLAGHGSGVGWTRWSHTWLAPEPGDYTLLARATDVFGRTQPDVSPFNTNGYFFDAVVRHPLTVA